MSTRKHRHFDIYSELYTVSSALVIGAGVVAIAMGSSLSGGLYLLAGVGLGVAGALYRSPVMVRSIKEFMK